MIIEIIILKLVIDPDLTKHLSKFVSDSVNCLIEIKGVSKFQDLKERMQVVNEDA